MYLTAIPQRSNGYQSNVIWEVYISILIYYYTSSTDNFSWPKPKESQQPTAAKHSSWEIDFEGILEQNKNNLSVQCMSNVSMDLKRLNWVGGLSAIFTETLFCLSRNIFQFLFRLERTTGVWSVCPCWYPLEE